MDRRAAWVLIAALAAVCVGLVLSVAYPFNTAEPHALSDSTERFSVGDTDAFNATGRFLADGEETLAFEGAVAADGAWYERVGEEHVTSWKYYPGSGETVYWRVRITGRDRAHEFRRSVTGDADRDLLETERAGNRTTLVFTATGDDGSEPVSGTASVFVNGLGIVGYERAGSDGAGLRTFEPKSGWYEGSRPYRITGATGAVDVNDEMTVRSANVSWDLTEPAGSLAEYVLVTVASDATTTQRVEFDYTPGATPIERPTWVPTASQG